MWSGTGKASVVPQSISIHIPSLHIGVKANTNLFTSGQAWHWQEYSFKLPMFDLNPKACARGGGGYGSLQSLCCKLHQVESQK